MRLSKLFFTSLRDDPADAEMASHKLLVRAGGPPRPTASGTYNIESSSSRMADGGAPS